MAKSCEAAGAATLWTRDGGIEMTDSQPIKMAASKSAAKIFFDRFTIEFSLSNLIVQFKTSRDGGRWLGAGLGIWVAINKSSMVRQVTNSRPRLAMNWRA